VPDPFNCHKSYAEHYEKEFENSIKDFGFNINFISQTKKYDNCDYAEGIKLALNNIDKIKNIYNRFRVEQLEDDWMPITIYCEKCHKDFTKVIGYDKKYQITYDCHTCQKQFIVDFRKKGIIKLVWRLDWPMRWNYEKVDFEPGGKDHSVSGGSFDTGKHIVKELWGREPPTYIMYEFVSAKGQQGKISSSRGGALTINEVLEIYETRIMKYLFIKTRPKTPLAISFDLDVLKVYEDFDKTERIYYGKEKAGEKETEKQKRIYELCVDKIEKKLDELPSFRHLSILTQIYEGDFKKAVQEFKSKKAENRAKLAYNWVKLYAPEDFKFELHKSVDKTIKEKLNEQQIKSLKLLREKLEKRKYTEQDLFNEFYSICEESGIKNTDFFEGAYIALIGKKKGPKLANFILSIGQDRVLKLLSQIQP
jgi:lysyl-tRNA synthetase class 1